MPEKQKEINIYPSRAYKHLWEDPDQGTLKPCLTLMTQLYCLTTSFSDMSVRLSVEMTSAPNSAVWLSTPFPPTLPAAISRDSSVARCPRYAVALLFQECKNYTLKGHVPLFCTYWTDLADSDISFLLFTPAGRKGHMVTCTPKSFCTTVEHYFFLIILWFSSLRKTVHGIPRLAWLPKAACLPKAAPSWSTLSGLAILLRDELC